MSENLITVTKLLSVGNIVSASIRIYRDNFKSYCGVAIRANLWFLLPFLAITPILLILIYRQANIFRSSFLLLIHVWLLLFAFCTTKSIVNSTIISRLVFGGLANQPETIRQARRVVAPKKWIFFRVFLGIFLIETVTIFILILVMLLFFGIIITYTKITVNVNDELTTVVSAIVFFGIFWILFATLLSRFVIVNMPLVIEENITATQTIRRCWELTKGYIRKIFAVLLVTILVALPIGMTSSIINEILYSIIIMEAPSFFDLPTYLSFSLYFLLLEGPMLLLGSGMTLTLILTIIGFVSNIEELNNINFMLLSVLFDYGLFFVQSIFLLPFWQTIKAFVYYDLRTRREGMDLQLRKQNI